jgi:8-oxo-dGTP pyrophosphatase MutT (NUDIX family)
MQRWSADDGTLPISRSAGRDRQVADGRGGEGRRLKTVRDVSAGGVAYRQGPEGTEVVLVGRHEPERWVLPKGTPNQGESLDQTAVREVAEETGIQVRLIRPLHDIQYWFVLHGVRHYKTVHFYLMEAVGGDTSLHDHEYDVAAWFPIAEAERRLAFANERTVVTKARAELDGLTDLADTTAAS